MNSFFGVIKYGILKNVYHIFTTLVCLSACVIVVVINSKYSSLVYSNSLLYNIISTTATLYYIQYILIHLCYQNWQPHEKEDFQKTMSISVYI